MTFWCSTNNQKHSSLKYKGVQLYPHPSCAEVYGYFSVVLIYSVGAYNRVANKSKKHRG